MGREQIWTGGLCGTASGPPKRPAVVPLIFASLRRTFGDALPGVTLLKGHSPQEKALQEKALQKKKVRRCSMDNGWVDNGWPAPERRNIPVFGPFGRPEPA